MTGTFLRLSRNRDGPQTAGRCDEARTGVQFGIIDFCRALPLTLPPFLMLTLDRSLAKFLSNL
jgi:hypothetical protein